METIEESSGKVIRRSMVQSKTFDISKHSNDKRAFRSSPLIDGRKPEVYDAS